MSSTVARAYTYLQHTRDVAERLDVGDLVVAELVNMGERLSGARPCRACRVGWSLVEEDGQLRAVAQPGLDDLDRV